MNKFVLLGLSCPVYGFSILRHIHVYSVSMTLSPRSLYVPRQGGNLGKIHTAVSRPLWQGRGSALLRHLCPGQELQGLTL